MMAVALVGVFVGMPLNWWNWVRSRANLNPLTAEVREVFGKETEGFVPFGLEFSFSLSSPKPPFGMFYSIEIEMSVHDEAARVVVARHTAYRHLISGVSEKSEGFVPWGVRIPKPGPYRFSYEVNYKGPFKPWKGSCGGYTRGWRTITRRATAP